MNGGQARTKLEKLPPGFLCTAAAEDPSSQSGAFPDAFIDCTMGSSQLGDAVQLMPNTTLGILGLISLGSKACCQASSV